MALHEYKCHKVVKAAKIFSIRNPSMGYLIEDMDGTEWYVNGEWFDRHKPEVGGYLVEYEDGYRSYSPAKAFEEGYTKVD